MSTQSAQHFHTVAIACDHAACELKEHLMAAQELSSYIWLDFGSQRDQGSVDYPDYARSVVKALRAKRVDMGICLCGTGIGMSIAANRDPYIRAAVVWNQLSAKLSRQHNNANVLCLGSRLLETKQAIQLVDMWLRTPFQGGRHQKRLEKLAEFH